jgi:polyhydroxyalkanoate synthesis regulator phasin
MTEALADTLIKNGYFSAEDLARTSVEELVDAARVSEADAEQFIANAEKEVVEAAARAVETDLDEEAETPAPTGEEVDGTTEATEATESTETPVDENAESAETPADENTGTGHAGETEPRDNENIA